MSPGRIMPLISPSFILPFEIQGQFFGKKLKWETAAVIFTEAPRLTAPHRNLSLSIICQTVRSFQYSESSLGTVLPQNKEPRNNISNCVFATFELEKKIIASLFVTQFSFLYAPVFFIFFIQHFCLNLSSVFVKACQHIVTPNTQDIDL